MNTEFLQYDVVIVGAGPAGLSAAIRLKQLNPDYRICILEKGAEVGAHALSGAVLEPAALEQLLPDWKKCSPFLFTSVREDHFLLLTEKKALHLPTPKQMKNKGNYIISLNHFCQWLGREAENLGVEIYPGFAASEIIFDENNHVCGVKTGDKGLDKQGEKTSRYQAGIALYAKQVLLAEGCRGFLSQKIIAHYHLDEKSDPPTYGLGIKELWEISPSQHVPGKVLHTVGWPLDAKTYGGSFLYHLNHYQIAVGFVIGLDYQNPYLDPFEEFQRFKLHPAIRPIFKEAKRIGYGARTLCEGGFQSLPKLDFPGGLLIGDSAGFLNVPKIKGIHMAMRSGMAAAEAVYEDDLSLYQPKLKTSGVWKELYRARNIRPGFRWGLGPGLLLAAIDTYIFSGRAPWTLRHKSADHISLKKAKDCLPIAYPKPDNHLTFDKLSSVYLSHIHSEDTQPCHLKLRNSPQDVDTYQAPEQRYCPAKVYEVHAGKLLIQAQNCIHCKACDIKDPFQNITWTPPEGGSGPNFSGL